MIEQQLGIMPEKLFSIILCVICLYTCIFSIPSLPSNKQVTFDKESYICSPTISNINVFLFHK